MSLKPIKAALSFTDSQLGVLAGAAFAVSYALFSPVGGWIVDRFPRKRVMVGAVAFFSLATFLTGFANSLSAMAMARIGVGVGESFISPLSASLIGDVVPRRRRPRVFSVYLSAGAVGAILALCLGGVLVQTLLKVGRIDVPLFGQIAPWQGLFAIAALLGFALTGAIVLFLREPARVPQIAPALDIHRFEDSRSFVRRYWRLIVAVFLGLSLFTLPGYTFATWGIVFFERVHGWSPARAAISWGATGGVVTLIGCLGAGRLIELLRDRGVVDAPLRVAIAAALLFTVLGSTAMFVTNSMLALALMAIAAVSGYVGPVCIYASLGDLIPASARGRFSALHTLVIGLVANAIGPLLVGLLNDHVFEKAESSIRYSLATLFVVATVGGVLVTAPGLSLYRKRMTELTE
jgi:MFS family permease